LPKYVSGSGPASVARDRAVALVRYRQVVQWFSTCTSKTRLGVRGVPSALAKLKALSSARRGARRMTAATVGGVPGASSMPPAGAPDVPAGGTIAGTSPW
jgi:hypothetical protein